MTKNIFTSDKIVGDSQKSLTIMNNNGKNFKLILNSHKLICCGHIVLFPKYICTKYFKYKLIDNLYALIKILSMPQ